MARDLILDAAVRSTLLLLLAALVAAIARRASAAFRHRVWAAALLGLIAVPLASALAPAWPLPVLPAPKREPRPNLPPAPGLLRPSALPDLPPEPEPVILHEVEPPPIERPSPGPASPAPVPPDAWTLAYSGGVIVSALPVLAGLAINARRRRRSRPAADWAGLAAELRATFAIRRWVDVRIGEDATIPATWGVLRPVVMLPAEAATWPEPTRRAVLAHELAHVRRLDWPVHLIARLAAALAWFHPLAWYALRRLRIEGEHACDDAVIASGERPAAYAEQLLVLARRLRVPRSSAALGMARSNKLEARMTALFDARRSHAPLSTRRALAMFALASLSILAASTARLAPRAIAGGAQEPVAEAAPITPAVRPSSTLKVRVRTAEGDRPVAKASVSLSRMSLDTDGDGQALFRPVAPGPQRVLIRAEGFASVAREVQVAQGAAAETTFRLRPGADLEGVVRDLSGQPVEGARVTCDEEQERDRSGADVYFAAGMTDLEGRYRLADLRRGIEQEVAVFRPGYLRQALMVRIDGPVRTFDFTMSSIPAAGVSVGGVVTDGEGRPIPDAEVAHQEPDSQVVRTRTDPDGRFLLTGLRPDALGGLTVWARAKDLAPKKVFVGDIPNDRRAEVAIALEAGRTIEGFVLDPDGRPLPGVRVDTSGLRPFDLAATTDEHGRFRFEHLPAFGDPPLTLRKPGYSNPTIRSVPIYGRTLRYTMHPTGVILGRAVDARTGMPLREFRLQYIPTQNRRPDDPLPAFPPGWTTGRDLKAEDGRFRIDEWPVGTPLMVLISAPGYDPAVIERAVAAPEAEARVLDFRLPPIDSVARTTYAGKLVGPGGGPLAGLRVWLLARRPSDDPRGRRDIDWWGLLSTNETYSPRLWLDWRYRNAVTDDQGRFTFADVPADAEVTALWWGDRDAAPGAVEGLHKLDDAARSAIVLTAPAAGRIVARVAPAEDAGRWTVEMVPVGFAAPSWTRTPSAADPTEFEADGLTPGEYQLRVVEHPYLAAPREIARRTATLRPGETLRVDFP